MRNGILRETGERGTGTQDWSIGADMCDALRRRGVLGAGYTSLGAGYRYIRLSPLFSHVGACLDGQVDYLIAGKWVRCPPGTVLIAPANVPHGSQAIEARKSGTSHIAWVLFSPIVKRPSHESAWHTGLTRLIESRDVRPLWWALRGLYVEATAPRDRMDQGAIGQWCDLVVATAMRLANSAEHEADPTRPVWERVDMDLRYPWTGADLADLAKLSETHFRRVCRTIHGTSPARHLAHLRMRRAAMLLSTTHDKLATIAAEVGYANVFAFSVAFKRYSGIVPSAYRAARSKNLDAPIG